MLRNVQKEASGTPEKNKRMKYVIVGFFILSALSCGTSRKAIKPVAPSDSLQTIPVPSVDSAALDSARTVAAVFSGIRDKRHDFKTFSSRVKLTYTTPDKSLNDVTAFLRMQKDSVIWVSLNAALGIEALRLLITPDTVKLLDKLNKTIQYRDFLFLQETTRLPVDFFILQDLLIGNPVFLDSNLQTYSNRDGKILMQTLGAIFRNNSIFDQNRLQVDQSHLEDRDTAARRSAQLEYLEYNDINGRSFSGKRKLIVMDKKQMAIELEFRQAVFDVPLSFPFAVPGNYKLK